MSSIVARSDSKCVRLQNGHDGTVWVRLATVTTTSCLERCRYKLSRDNFQISKAFTWLQSTDSCMSQSHIENLPPRSHIFVAMIVWPGFLIIVVCVGACALTRLLRLHFPRPNIWSRSLRHYPHIILVFGLDLFGRMWKDFYSGQFSEGIRGRHVLHGSTFCARILRNDYIYTIEPENIHTITNTQESRNFKKSEWASEAAKHIGNGILLNEGEAWRLSRIRLRPMFSSNSVDEPTLMEPHVRRLIAKMMALSENEGDFEFHRLADMLMLDVVTEFLFGKSTKCLEFPRGPAGDDGIDFLTHVRRFDGPSASFIALGAPARVKLLFSTKELNEAVVGMKAFFERKLAGIMTNTEESPVRTSPWSVFKMMKSSNIPDEQIRGELQNIFFAGWDTTSALLANTVYALLRHPHVQVRLREEIRSLRGMPPTKQDLHNMRYLRLVVKEGSCHPPLQKLSEHHITVQAPMTYHVPVHPIHFNDVASCSSPPLLSGHIALAQGQSRHHPSTRRWPRRPKPHCRPSGDDRRVVHVLVES